MPDCGHWYWYLEVGARSRGLVSAVGIAFSRPDQIDMIASPEKIRLRNTSRVDGTLYSLMPALSQLS